MARYMETVRSSISLEVWYGGQRGCVRNVGTAVAAVAFIIMTYLSAAESDRRALILASSEQRRPNLVSSSLENLL